MPLAPRKPAFFPVRFQRFSFCQSHINCYTSTSLYKCVTHYAAITALWTVSVQFGISAHAVSSLYHGADCLFVLFSTFLSMSLCVVCMLCLLLVSVRPSSCSGQPVSAPTTPTSASGTAAYATLFPTSLTVHSFVSLHQYCCPSTDQILQQDCR